MALSQRFTYARSFCAVLILDEMLCVMSCCLWCIWTLGNESEQIQVNLPLIRCACGVENSIDHPNCQRRRASLDGFDQLALVEATHPFQRVYERAGGTQVRVWHPLHDIEQSSQTSLWLWQCH